MKRQIKKAILMCAVAAFLLGSMVYAGCPASGWDGKYNEAREKRFEELKKDLALTAEQNAELKKQREVFKAKNKEIMEKLAAKRKELKEELDKKDTDRARIDGIVTEIASLTAQKMQIGVDKILSLKSVLTPEQYEKLKSKMEKRRPPRKGGFRRFFERRCR